MYKQGNDLLVSLDGKAFGHCTSHTASFNTETKDTAVKPLASVAHAEAAKFKSKIVTGLSVQVKAEGIVFEGETESSFKSLLAKWKVGGVVTLNLFERENDQTPYLTGSFVITSLEHASPAGDDSTWNATFDNDGAPDIDETKFDITRVTPSN